MSKVLTGNRRLVRELNRNLLLNIARDERQLSHSDLTKLTGLSKATVTSLIKETTDEGFLKITGPGESKLGRKPTLMRFNYDARHVVSAVFFADRTQLALVNLNGMIKDRLDFETQGNGDLRSTIDVFASNVQALLAKNNISVDKVLGAGASFEGMVDVDKGMLVLSARSGWRDVPVQQLIEDGTGLRTKVESEGAAMALGEYKYGAGRDHSHMVCIDVDSGIGSVELRDGRIWHGSHNMAGEIGHTPVMRNDLRCKCGNVGCLETVASGWAILDRLRAGLKKGIKCSISDDVHCAATDRAIRAVFEAAHRGDDLALEVVHEAGLHLSMAVAQVVNYADPELVVMTGCVTHESGGMLLDIVRSLRHDHILESRTREVRIEEGALRHEAALIGGAILIYEEEFKVPVSY